jgi:hypothetical protein
MSSAKAKKKSKKFDYETLSDNLRPEVREAADRIRGYKRKEEAAERERLIAAINIGNELFVIQNKLDYGRFLEWIDAEFDVTSRTAERYQRLAKVFGHRIESVSNLGLSRAHLLAQKSTPEAVITQVLERTNAGNRPSSAEIRKLIKTEQKRLEEEQLRKESAVNIEQPADTAAVGRANDSAEKPLTEPSIVDGVVEGTPCTSQTEDNPAGPAAGSNLADGADDDITSGEPVGGLPAVEGPDAEPPHTAAPGHDTVEPAGASNRTDGVGHGRTAEEPPPPAEGTGDEPEPTSDLVSSTIEEAAAGSNLAGGVGDARPAGENGNGTANAGRTHDAPTPKVQKTAGEKGGLFPSEALPVLPRPKAGNDKTTPPGQTPNEEPASPYRAPDDQAAAPKQGSDEQAAAPSRATEEHAAVANPAADPWFESNRRVTIFFQSLIDTPPGLLNPTLAGGMPKLAPKDWEEVWRSSYKCKRS